MGKIVTGFLCPHCGKAAFYFKERIFSEKIISLEDTFCRDGNPVKVFPHHTIMCQWCGKNIILISYFMGTAYFTWKEIKDFNYSTGELKGR